MKYTIYVTLEPILSIREIEDNSLSSVKCGFKHKVPESITRLVCANINNISIDEFFIQHRECTNIGSKIASNLIRVATQRIYSDPYRSFIEPVVNSIDSYNEMRGIPSTTGKFGMGFFSLLYWLLPEGNKKGNTMEIISTYKEDDHYCSWNAYISYESGNFTFQLLNSAIKKVVVNTGTKIIFHFIESQPIVAKLFDNIIYDTFSLVPNYIIRDNAKQVNESYKGPSIDIDYRINYIFNDQATGMSISTFLTKLLVPSISTKTIARSLSTELTYSGVRSEASTIPILEVDKRIEDKNIVSQFFINIRGISIYTESLTEYKLAHLIPKNDDGDFIRKEQTMYTRFVLSLPDQTPLPVSRDDIILTDTVFYEAAKKSLITLLHSCIDKNIPLDNILLHLQNYANYANDNQVYRLVGEASEYLYTLKDVYLVPLHYKYFYNTVIRPMTNKQYVGIDNAPVPRLTDHIMSITDIHKIKKFTNRTVLVVEDMKKLINVDYTTGGLISIIFVDSLFVKRKDWASYLIANMKTFLYDGRITISDEMNTLLNSKNAPIGSWKYQYNSSLKADTDTLVVEYMRKYADLIEMYTSRDHIIASFTDGVEGLYTYLYTITSFLTRLSRDRPFLDNAFVMIYSSLYKSANRDIHNTTSHNFTSITSNPTVPDILQDERYNMDNHIRLYLALGKLSIPVNTKYIIEYLWIFFSNISTNTSYAMKLMEPITFSCFNITNTLARYKEYSYELITYLYDKPPVYNVVYGFLKEEIYLFLIQKGGRAVEYLDYIYNELNIKYGLSAITRIVNDYINDYESADIKILVVNLRLGISLLSDTLRRNNYSVIYKHINDEKLDNTFTANQLISYLFEYNVDTNTLDWMKEVVKYKPHNKVKFQALEIAINEGTSKSFIESVLTELTQNSIDAAKESLYNAKENPRYQDGRVICRNKSGKSIIELSDNQIVSRTYTGDREPDRPCVNMLELIVGTINNHYGISVIDQVGIPIPGIIAIMLPFYSTKKAGEVISTGEMGTGFMNVYRQPYCREVWIRTFLDNEVITIKVVPLLDDYNRVIDLQYNVSRKRDSIGFGTNVTILFRKNTDVNYTSMMSEALIYAYSFYPTISMESYINNDLVSSNNIFLFENNIAKVYLRVGKRASSVILTNGVPYAWLRNYLDEFASAQIRNYGSYNIIIDLKRDSYKPQQSRKRIMFSENTNKEFMETIALASLLNAIDDSLKNNKSDSFSGMDYGGDPSQRYSSSSYLMGDIRYLSELRINTMNIPSVGKLIYDVTNTMKANKIKGKLSENVTRPYIVEATKTIKNYNVIREMYINIMIKWFSNKEFKEDDKTKDKDKKTVKIVIPDSVTLFLNKLITYAWHEAVNLISRNEMYPFNIKLEPPNLFYDNLPLTTKGYYSPGQHIIVLNATYYVRDTDKAIDKFKKVYSVNKDNAARLMLTDTILKELIGDQIQAVTLVHEFYHAIRSDSHGPDVHGRSKFTLEGLKYDVEYDKAANTIWRRLISDFNPLI